MNFPLNRDALPQGTLNTAVDRLIEDVSTRVLKRKLEDNDVVTVNNGVELPCTIFSQLRQGEWFDAWTIRGAMDISDKPLFVQYRYSIPLDEYGRNDRMKSIKRPFAGWARDIAKIRSQAKELSGELVYFCPLNHKNMHFSLLEINEREGVIRHYDSMADQGIINGISTPTRVCRLVQEEFGSLKYIYSEAPTPQQSDDWSCGIRVVWNFKRLSNNLPIVQ